jgi:hypothetical protein
MCDDDLLPAATPLWPPDYVRFFSANLSDPLEYTFSGGYAKIPSLRWLIFGIA